MSSISLTKALMLAVSVAQGCLLYLIVNSFKEDLWLSQSPMWFYPLISLAVGLPLGFILTVTEQQVLKPLGWVAGYGLIVALVGIYIGFQAEPFNAFPIDSLTASYVMSFGLASFLALLFIQWCLTENGRDGRVLSVLAWRNALILLLAWLLVLAAAIVCALWAALFVEIGITYYQVLFQETWFIVILGTTVFGVGIIVFRALVEVIDNIINLISGLIKLLLPLVLFVAVMFLLALPGAGLDVLWSTNRGTGLLLLLMLLILVGINIVYADGLDALPYGPVLHRLVTAALFVLPFLSILSYQGLTLRLDQYGWTVARCWAFMVWGLITLYTVGWVGALVRRRANWPALLGYGNARFGVCVIGLLILANSPLLDFRKLALASQLERLETGLLTPAQFDADYLRAELARPGHEALIRLGDELGIQDPAQSKDRIVGEDGFSQSGDIADGASPVNWDLNPKGLTLPVQLFEQVNALSEVQQAAAVHVVAADLNNDGQPEYAVLLFDRVSNLTQSFYFTQLSGSWQKGVLGTGGGLRVIKRSEIQNQPVSVQESNLQPLTIGNIVFNPLPLVGE